jgi:hypothetical protein
VIAKSAVVAVNGRLFSGSAMEKSYPRLSTGTRPPRRDDDRITGDDEASPVAIKACARGRRGGRDPRAGAVEVTRDGRPYALLEVTHGAETSDSFICQRPAIRSSAHAHGDDEQRYW